MPTVEHEQGESIGHDLALGLLAEVARGNEGADPPAI